MSIIHEQGLSPLSTPCLSTPCLSTPCLSTPCRPRAKFPPIRKEFNKDPQRLPAMIEKFGAPIFKLATTLYHDLTRTPVTNNFMPESAKSASTAAPETQFLG